MRLPRPSTELRQWFWHDPDKWIEFKLRYQEELKLNPEFSELSRLSPQQNIPLFYADNDTAHSQAVVLKEMLEKEGWPL